jgi:hypothetical protein
MTLGAHAPENAMATCFLRFLLSLLLALGLLGVAAAEDPDPPARVGRVSLVEGDVAYQREGEWVPLPVNWPISTGTRLSAAPGARAELHVGSTAVRLAEATELEVTRLDDDAIALRLLHGTIDARIRSDEVAQTFSVETPAARATLLEPGRYRFEADVVPDTTVVSTYLGAARVEAGGNAFTVHPGKRAELSPNGDVRLGEARPDAFDEWALARDRLDEAPRSVRYVSPEMTGYEALDQYGDWREVPAYGTVWVPRVVPADWAPYRTGRWAWIDPWGWTWIDEAPWGFAPFHYGRWAFVGGIWVWAPGRIAVRPVYAPALVGWVGRPGWSVTVSIGSVPAVGWFPLAPREVFVPAYRCSTAYVRHVNVAHVTNVTQITNATNVTSVNYVNRRIERAVTVVPAAAVTNGQPVARAQVHVRRADLDREGPASHTPPVAAVPPPGPIAPRGRVEPSDRPREAPHAERRGERRPELRTPPAPSVTATPSAPVAQPPRTAAPATSPLQTTPATPARAGDRALPAAGDRAAPRGTDRPQARGNERGPEGAPRTAEPRPAAGQEVQPAAAPQAVAPTPSPVQAQPRIEPRPSAPAPVVRAAPLAPSAATPAPQAQHPLPSAPPRAVAPPPSPVQAQPRFAPHPSAPAPGVHATSPAPSTTTPAPQRQLPSAPPRAVAPPPSPVQAQPRIAPRPSAPAPGVHAAPPAPPTATPGPQPQHQQPSAPRGDRDRGQGREPQRGEGRSGG